MKSAVVGALLVSLVAGSAAMAGQGFRGNTDHRDPPRAAQNDHRSEPSRDARNNGHNDGRWNDNNRGRNDSARNHDNGRHYDNGRNYGRDHNYRPAPPAPRYVYRPARPRYVVYHPPRGYYEHSWRRGERLPVAYYDRPYVIADYRDCGLRAPPRGYHWVRVNGDAVLAAVATGIVLDAVFHVF